MKKSILVVGSLIALSLLIGGTATVALYAPPEPPLTPPGIVGAVVRPGGVTEIDTVPAPGPGGSFVAAVDAAALPFVRAAVQGGGRVVNFDVITPPLSVTQTTVPVSVLRETGGLAVRVQTATAAVEVAPATVGSLVAANTILNVTIRTPAIAPIAAVMPAGTERVGSPVAVEANFTGNMAVTIPLTLFVPTDATARAAFMARFRVLSIVDGVVTTLTPTFTFDELAVPPLLTGVTFTTTRSGAFAVIR